jgi:hypothetical protein
MALTTARGAVGTPAYMAPEQARDTRQASAASDVYSLGATLAFASTGHPPYAGDTVMDVLARLATEPPDLSGLPGELRELITACLHRVPRMRPTSSAVLAQLGHFTEARSGPAEEHSYLPEAAMALIAGYQRNPLLAGGPPAEEHGEDVTSASLTELPASYKPPPRRRPEPGRPRQATAEDAGPLWWRWVRTHLAWVGWASVGAALVTAGVILGASLTSSGTPMPVPPPPQTVCGSHGQVGQKLIVCMNQSRGYSSTRFVVEGAGFAPRTSLTVMLSEVGPPPGIKQLLSMTSSDKPVTGPDGTFKVPVSQLYSGPLLLGLFTVEVTAANGSQAQTQFMVIPDGAPLQGPPPGG